MRIFLRFIPGNKRMNMPFILDYINFENCHKKRMYVRYMKKQPLITMQMFDE